MCVVQVCLCVWLCVCVSYNVSYTCVYILVCMYMYVACNSNHTIHSLQLARRCGSIQSHQMFAILFLLLAVLMPSIHYLAVAGQ